MGRSISRDLKEQIPSERCYYCGCELDSSNRTYDHVMPRKKGGEDTTSNLVACCGKCNGIKKDYTLYELINELDCQRRFCDDEKRMVELDYYKMIFSDARKRLRTR